MKQLIITADDYGMSRAVNDAIEAGMAAGLITTTNVMTNMPLYKEAKTLKDKFPNVSVGVHWTLSGAGKPVTPKDQVPSLVNEKGDLFSYAEFRKRYRNGLIKDEEILKELRGQYERYYDLMGMPDYWNTHQNTHVDFKIYQLFVALAAELKIPAMRSHQRIYVPASNPNDKLPLVWRIIEPFK